MNIKSLDIHIAGYCTAQKSDALRNSERVQIKFPALLVLIEHERKGLILFDTGYSRYFFEASAKFPYHFYRKATPVFFNSAESVVSYLHRKNIDPRAIKYIIVSHFHADHIGGLRFFKEATYITHIDAFRSIEFKKGVPALLKGFLPDLMPKDFSDRAIFLTDEKSFIYQDLQTWDLFEDGSLLLQKVEGHAKGQLGMQVQYNNQQFFFIADAAWLEENYKQLWLPHPKVKLFFSSWKNYVENLNKINQIYQYTDIHIVPTHCLSSIYKLKSFLYV